jgi:hypothetical protein
VEARGPVRPARASPGTARNGPGPCRAGPLEIYTFVTVSRTPHIPKFLKDILSGVGYRDTEVEDDVQKLIEILRATLNDKRYVFIWSLW